MRQADLKLFEVSVADPGVFQTLISFGISHCIACRVIVLLLNQNST